MQFLYKFWFSHEGIMIYALLTPVNYNKDFNITDFNNTVEDALMAEIERLGADESFYANNTDEALEFLEQALVGVATVTHINIEKAKQIVL